MRSLEELSKLVADSNLEDLRVAFASPDHLPCIHITGSCSNDRTAPCPRTVEYLADQAAKDGQLEVWCYLFDSCLNASSREISWHSMRHVVRGGDVEFAEAFELRQPGWANSIEPMSAPNKTRSMTLIKLAVMRGQLDFLDYLTDKCHCDVNAGGNERSSVCMVVRMDIDDGQYRCIRKGFDAIPLIHCR